MTISLFIPTTPKHFGNLDSIIKKYIDGTVIPNEIVVSVSDSHLINKNIIDSLENKYKDFNIKIIRHRSQINTGPNRQVSKSECTSDIITYNDSDDYPHKQRIEIIKYFFENYDIVHLNHTYHFYRPGGIPEKRGGIYPNTVNEFTDELVDIKDIEFVHSKEIFDKYFPDKTFQSSLRRVHHYGDMLNFPIHGGCPSIRKEVLNDIRWRDIPELIYAKIIGDIRSEDFDFCMETLYHYNKSVLINSPIYYYTSG